MEKLDALTPMVTDGLTHEMIVLPNLETLLRMERLTVLIPMEMGGQMLTMPSSMSQHNGQIATWILMETQPLELIQMLVQILQEHQQWTE